ncbi:synaptogenesis protein syg-2-like isoform X2 [Penaeus japonicus]|uniref:synaptogenesis protein syg-2-like isoform X2 n=1 Tax=Penaeus japonicus TaxID=27405 RepID=UPI001C70E78B|nr:synaptogenesis protein syg-2-like isoform X2 [Penaeus japonicus]
MLTLWFKSKSKKPMYSYDARSSTPREWSDSSFFGDRAKYVAVEQPPYLAITDVKATDEGVYECRVDFARSPSRRHRTSLGVIIPPGTPRILRNDSTVASNGIAGPYNEGSNVTITCQVKGGKPPPQVKWWRENELQDDEVEKRMAGEYRNELHIGPLTREHLNAKYVCQVTNHELVDARSANVVLLVNLPPLEVKFVDPPSHVVAGKSHAVQCKSSGGRPHSRISWWLDGKPFGTEAFKMVNKTDGTLSTLTFTPTEEDHNKMLHCKAESPVLQHTPIEDTLKLDVYSVPKVLSIDIETPDPAYVKEGENVTLWCRVKAYPKVKQITWYHKGIQVRHNLEEGIKVGRQKLMMIGIERHRAGMYSCRGTNAVGDGQSEPSILDVKYAPVCSFNSSEKVGIARNDQVMVQCRVDASPGHVTFKWYLRTNTKLINIPTEWFTVQDRTSSLNYNVTGIYAYGDILCYASNELGEQAKPCSYTLVPAGRPEPPRDCTASNHTADTFHVACFPGYDGGLEQEFVVLAFDDKNERLIRNETVKGAPVFTLEDLPPESDYLVKVYAQNIKGKSTEQVLHGFTLPSAQPGTAVPATHIFPITPILGVLIGVVAALVLVAVVVVVVMKLRGDTRTIKGRPEGGLKGPHSPLHPAKDGDDGPDVILCRTDSTYEDVDGIPQKLKHANIYETVPYDTKDKNSKNSEVFLWFRTTSV